MLDYKKILIVLGLLALLCSVSYFVGRRDGRNKTTRDFNEVVDTMVIYKTITQYEPILEERVVLQKVPVIVSDTMWIHDTMYVYLDREQVMWQDSLSKVYASGILPQIDSVQHFITERIVTRELTQVVKKPCRWGLGIHAGYGVSYSEKFIHTPYVGVGISYNILSW